VAAGGGWSDSALGDVRPYTLTGGRTESRHALRLTTCLLTRPATGPLPAGAECETLLMLCSGSPRSVAELAGHLRQPVQVVKILIGDLLDANALIMASPTVPFGPAGPSIHVLEALRDALQRML
jgi:hypothetical protein